MTATRIPSEIVAVPDFVTMTEPGPDKTMAELAVALVAMFTEDDSLPQPGYLTPSRTSSAPAGHLPRQPLGGRFGGTVTGAPRSTATVVRCQAVRLAAWP